MIRRPPKSTLFPYPPLSRSVFLVARVISEDERAPAPPGEAARCRPEQERMVRVEDVEVDRRDQPRDPPRVRDGQGELGIGRDRKSTRLNSSHLVISYAVFCL